VWGVKVGGPQRVVRGLGKLAVLVGLGREGGDFVAGHRADRRAGLLVFLRGTEQVKGVVAHALSVQA